MSIQPADLPPNVPEWASNIYWFLIVVGGAGLALLGRLAIRRGQKQASTPDHATDARVVSVIVDPTALNRAASAGEAISVALIKLDGTLKSMARTIGANTRQIEIHNQTMAELRETLERVRDEIVRASAK